MHRSLRRVALVLAVSLGLVGVVAYAQGLDEEETLAGPAITLEEGIDKGDGDVGSCPANFPIEVPVKADHPADKNGDHVVCTDEHGKRFVDNDFVSEEKGPSQVTGHGNFLDAGKKILQDISFSFHGINTGDGSKRFSDAAKGQFEYHDQTLPGRDMAVHGDVLCLSVSDNTALLVGRVTSSTDPKGLPVDTLVAWMAEDNGEGIDVPVDRVSRLTPIGGVLPKECRIKLPVVPVKTILSGNIQVR